MLGAWRARTGEVWGVGPERGQRGHLHEAGDGGPEKSVDRMLMQLVAYIKLRPKRTDRLIFLRRFMLSLYKKATGSRLRMILATIFSA